VAAEVEPCEKDKVSEPGLTATAGPEFPVTSTEAGKGNGPKLMVLPSNVAPKVRAAVKE
jgi:hypothetical protein